MTRRRSCLLQADSRDQQEHGGMLTLPDAYTTAHATPDAITWQEFTESFRNHHIPAGVMRLKKKEFLSLKQGWMSVAEYRDRFIELSRYAPEEVVDDPKKQERFLEGLAGPLHYQLTSHTFQSLQ
jgi:hypothetical protein